MSEERTMDRGTEREVRRIIKAEIGGDLWLQVKARAKDLVEEGREIEGRHSRLQWAWGDLSLEAVPTALGRKHSRLAAALLRTFINDCGYPNALEYLRKLRTTCGAYPKGRRSTKASFAVHSILASHPDRFRLLRDDLTVEEARRLLNRRELRPALKRATGIECASAARSWLRAAQERIAEKPSDDEIAAIAETWRQATAAAAAVGILDDLLAEMDNAGMVAA